MILEYIQKAGKMAFGALNGSYVGSQVRVTVPDGVYDGILNSLDVNTTVKRLTLEKIRPYVHQSERSGVPGLGHDGTTSDTRGPFPSSLLTILTKKELPVTSCKNGKKINGIQNFFSYEIQNVEIIQDNRKKVVKRREDVDGPFLISRRQNNAHLAKLRQLDSSKILLKGSTTGEKKVQDEQIDTGPPITCIRNLNDALENTTEDQLSHQDWPAHYLVISKNDHVFSDAIIHIQKQTTIGLAVEGVKLGRRGTISFLQVGTRSYVFVFDVLALGKILFEDGLKKILEHRNIQKVLHDCRWVSDALFHQHGVKLINVFDTAVSDMVIYKNRHNGDVPRYIQSVSTLLITHLAFNSNDANWYKTREQALKTDQKVWLTRPVPQRVLIVAVRHVMYLVQLRVAMLEAMLQEFQDGVDVFLGFVRDAHEDKLDNYDKNRHVLPERLNRNYQSEAQQYQRLYKDRYQDKTYVENQRDSFGRRENCPGSLDTNVIFSHDSVWHQGSGTHLQGASKTQVLQECHRRGIYFMGKGDHRAALYNEEIKLEKEVLMSQDTMEDEDDDCLMALGEQKINKKKKPKQPAPQEELLKSEDSMDDEDGDCLMALGEKMNRKKKKPKPKQPASSEEPMKSVPYTTCIPAGCPASTIDFPYRDVRIKRNDMPLRAAAIDGSDDVIPCHANLVKADPMKHRAVPTAGQKVAWEDGSLDTSDLNTSAVSGRQPTSEASSGASSLASPQHDNPRPALGRGVVGLTHAVPVNGVGAAAATSDSSDSDSRQVPGMTSLPSGRGLGRGVLMKLIVEKMSSPPKQVPVTAAASGQFLNAD